MFKQLQHTFATQKWLRTWDAKEKHTLLCFRIAERIDGASDNSDPTLRRSMDWGAFCFEKGESPVH